MYNGVICAFKSVLVVAQTRERRKFLSVYKRFYRVGNILKWVKWRLWQYSFIDSGMWGHLDISVGSPKLLKYNFKSLKHDFIQIYIGKESKI